ncbi:type III pantothenate kinase [Marinobacter sp. VGCF2001]|uniref:type III pantothenate kinase n=1 Tax=Marinobacter sp. VGCF2001 TaxID=3417189 RepID=UPI003CE91FDF
MILLIDAGNTRLKWRLMGHERPLEGLANMAEPDPLIGLAAYWSTIERILVSTVASDEARQRLDRLLQARTDVPVQYYWSEHHRDGLFNSYQDVSRMGADRWHAMLAGWRRCGDSFAVVDAGSAITVDYVSGEGRHLGGYIIPGLQMMRRSLKIDAARIGFEHSEAMTIAPGQSTAECVNHGLVWLTEAVVWRVRQDLELHRLNTLFLTGGDAGRINALGLNACVVDGLVLEGLERIALTGCHK